MSNELLRKVRMGCIFGVPSETVAEEIVREVRELQEANLRLERLVLKVRGLCEADGVSTTVQAIRRTIDG